MQKNIFTFVLLFVFPVLLMGQFTDDFTDGNFTHNPSWTGDTDKFVVDNNRLRLNDNIAGSSYLATSSTSIHDTQWEFWVRLAFSPNDNNFSRIYLVSDSDDLNGDLNGYFVQLGSSDAQGALRFFRQDGSDITHLHTGITNISPSTNNLIRVKVRRNDTGTWEFWVDPKGGESFFPQGTITDNQHTSTSFFGVYCRYSATNSDRMYFDDFYVGEMIEDTTPPEVVFVDAVDQNHLDVYFSKPVEQSSAESLVNYFVLGPGVSSAPVQAERDALEWNKVRLSFSQNFQQDQLYEVFIENVVDYHQNVLVSYSGVFALYQPQRHDVVFTEIMANPTPAVGLPPHRYVEIYNTTEFPLNLSGWKLLHGTTQTERVLPFVVLPPKSYAVFTYAAGFLELNVFDNVYEIPGLSTTFLTNSGTRLILEDPQGEIITTVLYSDTWYGDADKDGGGWSLEKIDPYNLCGEAENWTASNHPSGGTPGTENSVMADNPDTTQPIFWGAEILSPVEIMLYFDQPMDENTLLSPDYFTINQGVGHPIAANPIEPDFRKVQLIMSLALEENQVYEITLSQNITDCAGNVLVNHTALFSDYEAERFDIVFNEIMANPTPEVGLPPHRYIEFYNTSDYPINLHKYLLTHGSSSRELPFITIMPKDYVVLVRPAAFPYFSDYDNVFAVPDLASSFLTVGGTTLGLYGKNEELIHTVNYSDSWYREPGKSNGGWALEAIDPYNFCGEADNWRASLSELGGTPGFENSVRADNPDTKNPVLLRAGYEAADKVSLFFNEAMDEARLLNPEHYSMDNDMGQPTHVEVIAPAFRKVVLSFDKAMQANIIYRITASENLTDCAGNPLTNNTVKVAVPQAADSLDLVLNEILFNPPDNGVRYVEIYNRSQKVIDLQNHYLSNKDTVQEHLTGLREISTESHLIFPEEYRVLTPNPDVVQSQFMTPHPLHFVRMTLPGMTNSAGVLVIANKTHRIMDMFVYKEDMHYTLLTTKKGVALERLNYHRPTQSRNNWHSAAQNVGFGTPAFKNSQFTHDPDGLSDVFEVDEIFSPNNDGDKDVLNIRYELEEPGYTANVNIYDSRGRLIRVLSQSELLGTSGSIVWDGTTDQDLKANIGIYVIMIELFNPNGSVRSFKKTTVLAGKM